MLKPLKCFAIVKKENPKLDLNEVYKKVDIEGIHINKDEKIVEVEIKPL